MEPTRNRAGARWDLLWRWVAVTVLTTALAGEVVRRLVPLALGYGVATVVAVGLAVPALVGLAQGLALRSHGFRVRSWLLATVAGSLVLIAWTAPWADDVSISRQTRVDGEDESSACGRVSRSGARRSVD